MPAEELRWRRYGDHGVLIELDSLHAVHTLHRTVLRSGLARECVPGATTLYVESHLSTGELMRSIDALPVVPEASDALRTHTIAVVYDGADLLEVARITGLTVEEVVALHTAATYVVAFLGFSRAFPYLSGLHPRLVVPRLSTPRTSVPAGSVAMGAGFTGIYPMSSPGGWRLLGRTTERFFDEGCEPPSRLVVGDAVRFHAVGA